MGKTSKKKKNLADKIRQARSARPVKGPSAFDLHINKQKHNILGRNQTARGEVGNPVQSRTRAIEQRRKTLLKEYKNHKKSNQFKDKRLAESTDRLALERKMEFERRNLDEEEGEEEVLTHLGQSVSEIENFDEAQGSDSDEDDGRLPQDVTKEFFGGYLTEKDDPEKSWKERMSELISQSKKDKYERQSEKDKMRTQIEEMDAEFTSINRLMLTKRTPGAEKKKPISGDEYSERVILAKQEIRGNPSDRLKTETELAKEEAERLQKLEEERKRRMKGELASFEPPTHMSADSLDDGFSYSMPASAHKAEDKSDEDEEDDNKSDDEKSDGEEKSGEEEESGDEDEADTDNSDLEEEEEDEEEEPEKSPEKLLKKKGEKQNASTVDKTKLSSSDPQEEQKGEEMPYTFTAPEDMDGLVSLLSPYSPEDQMTVLDRLVACHHPSLAEGNKQKLQLLFGLLVQYLMDVMAQKDGEPPVLLFDHLAPLLHQLLRHDPDGGAKSVQEIILSKIKEFQNGLRRKRCSGLDTLMLLKLVQVLFPTSDFRHPVVTPAFHLITALLSQSPVQTGRDIAAGLFLCLLCSEYVSLSKRYIPEAINFLHGVLFLAAKKSSKKVDKVFPPFKPVGNFTDLLKLNQKVQHAPILSLLKSLAADQDLDTDEFRVSCISTCVALLQEFADLYFSLPAVRSIFAPVSEMLQKLPLPDYPQGLQECVDKLQHKLKTQAEQPLEALTMEKEKPQPLKLIEPVIQEVFDGRKKRTGTREQQERERLKHKVKKEMKGAMREIRKDTQFLANQKMEDTKKLDTERRAKLKRIYADLSNQEGEVRALKRLKDKTSGD